MPSPCSVIGWPGVSPLRMDLFASCIETEIALNNERLMWSKLVITCCSRQLGASLPPFRPLWFSPLSPLRPRQFAHFLFPSTPAKLAEVICLNLVLFESKGTIATSPVIHSASRMTNSWWPPCSRFQTFSPLLGPKLIKINYISGHVGTKSPAPSLRNTLFS